MGLLTEFFACTRAELHEFADEGPSGRPVPSVLARGVDDVKILTLYAIIAKRDALEMITSGESEKVIAIALPPPDEGPWVFAFAPELTSTLASIPDQALDALARDWAETEEWQMDGGTASELSELVVALRALCRSAHEAKTSVFLWTSL